MCCMPLAHIIKLSLNATTFTIGDWVYTKYWQIILYNGAISWLTHTCTHPATYTHTHTHRYTHTHVCIHTSILTHTLTALYMLHMQTYTYISKHTPIKNAIFFYQSQQVGLSHHPSLYLVTSSPTVDASIQQDIITNNYDSRNGCLYPQWMSVYLGTQSEM